MRCNSCNSSWAKIPAIRGFVNSNGENPAACTKHCRGMDSLPPLRHRALRVSPTRRIPKRTRAINLSPTTAPKCLRTNASSTGNKRRHHAPHLKQFISSIARAVQKVLTRYGLAVAIEFSYLQMRMLTAKHQPTRNKMSCEIKVLCLL